jgi:hypothetical protein
MFAARNAAASGYVHGGNVAQPGKDPRCDPHVLWMGNAVYKTPMRIVDLSSSPTPGATSLGLLGFMLLLQGCPTNDPATDTGPSDGDTSAGDGDGDGDPGDGDPGDGDGDWEPIPARGDIALTDVVVNQGVDVAIASDGVWVGPADRNTFVVASRDTLLRGFWEIPDDWLPREITAKLDLRYPDGTETSLTDTKMIMGPSFAGDLERGFIFQLLADQFPPGLEYHMTLWEAAPGAEDQRESTSITESPIGGLQLIGAQSEPVQLKVVVMPVVYDDGEGCSTDTSTQVTAEQEQRFINYLHEQYPVQEIIWEFRRDTPIQWNTKFNSIAELWGPLQEQRAADNAAPNVYYYALVDACSGGVDGAAGIAPGLATDTKAAAFERVSSGLWINDGDEYSYHVMVHELGHNHGRAHVFCAGGDAAGTDPSYPYDDGIIGVWGFGIRLFQLHSPTATRDIMTYCAPNWVSDWGWSKAFNRVRTLTAWDYEAPGEPEPPSEVLIGLLFKNGSERWWTTPGAREAEHFSSGELIQFDYGDAVIASPTNVQILDDGTTMITTMVPRPNVDFAGATRIAANQVRAIEL